MTKKQLLARIYAAQNRVRGEIGGPAAGLYAEGYAGGFRQALYDITNLLHDVEPSDDRGYWRDD